MALSGNLSTAYKGWTYRIEWSATQSVSGNTSTITCTHKLTCAATYALNISAKSGSCSVGGVAQSFTSAAISTGGGTTHTLGTTKHTVTHNSDGTKSVAISGTFNIEATLSGTWKQSIQVNGTITLDTIPRASQPSLITWPNHTQNVGYFGDTISVHMNRNDSSFTHTVRYAFGSKSGTCVDVDTGKAATGVTTGIRWKIPEDFMDLLPASTEGSGTIYVDTYNGGTKIGTKYCGFTAKVNPNVIPRCSIQVLDATTTKDTYGSLVAGLSKLYVKTTGVPVYSSPISSYNVFVGPFRYTEAEFTTSTAQVLPHEPVVVSARVTDQRGRTSAEATASFPVLEYQGPTISALTVHRCDAAGNEDEQGDYIRVTFSASITPLNNKNGAAYKLRYKKSVDSTWTEQTLTALAGKYAVSNSSHIVAADGSSSYDVEVLATDNHSTTTRATSASTAFTLMNWHKSGTGMAIGGVSEKERTLQVKIASEFEEVSIRGNRCVYASTGQDGTNGFVLMAKITLLKAYADTPITFVFTRSGITADTDMKVSLRFSNPTMAETSVGVSSFRYEGSNYGAFLVRESSSSMTWDLYVQKANHLDAVALQDWYTSKTMEDRIAITFPGTQVSTVPSPYYRATPAVPESILDAFMPVGFVLTLYSHADPNDMYPGTTWVRLSGGFLWAVDASGTIGLTGGAKEVTLTVDQIPSHSHGSVYSQHAPGTKGQAWYTTAGTALAYGAVATGGGQAHNNMPPYIQVSIWRRTA